MANLPMTSSCTENYQEGLGCSGTFSYCLVMRCPNCKKSLEDSCLKLAGTEDSYWRCHCGAERHWNRTQQKWNKWLLPKGDKTTSGERFTSWKAGLESIDNSVLLAIVFGVMALIVAITYYAVR